MPDLAAEVVLMRAAADIAALPRAWGESLGEGRLRCRPEDFFVREHTGLQLRGQGEHLYVQLRKTGQNTRWVAKRLAEFAGVPYKSVSYAGLKDRHAVAEQWFSLHLPGATDPDWANFELDGVEVLQASRHDKKLRQGQLSYNRFQLTVRECTLVHNDQLEERMRHLSNHGVPNYFGPQRFGRNSANLELVLRAPELRRLKRETRAFAISSLRAGLFNGYLAERVRAGTWLEELPGEATVSDRPRGVAEADVSVFGSERLPAGVLWGRGMAGSAAHVQQLEEAFFSGFPAVCAALDRVGARFSRRVLRARVGGLQWRYDEGVLQLEFALGPGVFATAVLREIMNVEDQALAVMEGTDDRNS
jgi:tRNA pseudouridine13 synthase